MSYRFASLSSGLLARKGAAQPAMNSHGGGNPRPLREQVSFVTVHDPEPSFPPNAALGKAGFAFDETELKAAPPPPPPRFAPPPLPPFVPRSEAALAPRSEGAFGRSIVPPMKAAPFAPADSCDGIAACAIAEKAGLDPAKRFHVSVRLRQGHFVRLKLASAQLRKPSQDIVGDALAAYFRTLDPSLFGECACSKD